jgi:hypothetical protein
VEGDSWWPEWSHESQCIQPVVCMSGARTTNQPREPAEEEAPRTPSLPLPSSLFVFSTAGKPHASSLAHTQRHAWRTPHITRPPVTAAPLLPVRLPRGSQAAASSSAPVRARLPCAAARQSARQSQTRRRGPAAAPDLCRRQATRPWRSGSRSRRQAARPPRRRSACVLCVCVVACAMRTMTLLLPTHTRCVPCNAMRHLTCMQPCCGHPSLATIVCTAAIGCTCTHLCDHVA